MKFRKIKKKLTTYLQQSALINAFKRLASSTSEGLSGSLVVNMPVSVMKRDFLSESVTGKAFVSALDALTKKAGMSFADKIRESYTYKALAAISRAVREVTMKELFAFLAAASGVGGAINLWTYGISPKEILLFAGFVISLSLFFFGGTFGNNYLVNIAKDSVLVREFCSLLGVNIPKVRNEENIKHKDQSAYFAAAGLVVGILLGFISFKYAVLLSLCILGAIFIVIWPQLGLLLMTATVAFAPTMAEVALAVYTMVCMLLKKLLKREKVIFDTAFVFAAAFALIAAISAALSFMPIQSLPVALIYVAFIGSYLTAYNLTKNKKFIDILIKTFTLAAGLCALYGLYQYINGGVDMTWVDAEMFKDVRFRVYSTFQNPNVYAEFLALAIPISAAAVFRSDKISHRVIFSGIGGMLIVNLILTYARGGYLALILAGLIFVLSVEKRILLLGFAGLFALPFVLPQSVIQRFMSIGNMSDSSTSYRYMIWQGTAKMLKDYWAMGIGLGYDAFNSVYSLYSFSMIVAPHSHNLYLQIAVETGIWGLIAFFAFAVFYFCRILSCSSKMLPVRERSIFAAFAAGIGAFLLFGLFDFVWYNYRLVLTFWLLCGVSSAAVHLYREGGGEEVK